MAFLLNGVLVVDETGWRVPTQASRPANPVEGQVYFNTTNRLLEMFESGYWVQVQDTNRPFLYRTVITTSYVCGGYKDGIPYRNVNRMTHATNVCTNIGDQISTSFAYAGGACNLTKGFFWSTSNDVAVSSANGIAFNMATETNAGGITSMRNSRNNFYAAFKETQIAYLCGGGTGDVDTYNMTNETMYNSSMGPDTMAGDGYQSGVTGFSDELAAYLSGNAYQKLVFSTTVDYQVVGSGVGGSGSQQKGISSKRGKGYFGNEGTYNGGFNLRRYQTATDTNIGNVAKPIGNSGEENFDMGQDHQYMLGMYDGAQNNRGWRFSYVTDSGFELGAGSVRTGVPGGSSAQCVWKG
jgi:hypothetical protein